MSTRPIELALNSPLAVVEPDPPDVLAPAGDGPTGVRAPAGERASRGVPPMGEPPLRVERAPTGERVLRALADRLVELLAAYVPDVASLGTAKFREHVQQRRDALAKADSEGGVSHESRQLLALCEGFLERVRAYNVDRDEELAGVVQVMHDLVESLRGDARQFQEGLLASSSAMARLADVDDIRQLKRSLVKQAEDLKRTVVEQQQHEAARFATFSARVDTLEQSLATARREAATDPLTGLANRGTFDLVLRRWLGEADRSGQCFALVMTDLDDFKVINDTHGHQVGDRVLIAAARLLETVARPGDLVARYGGEEIALLLAGPSASDARARTALALDRIAPAYEYQELGVTKHVNFSFSGGVTVWVRGDTTEDIIKRADEALYDAKHRGKHRVEVRTASRLRALFS